MIQARAVGNHVYVEEEGMAGNYCVFGLSDGRGAAEIADGINQAFLDASDQSETEERIAELAAEVARLEAEVARLKADKPAGRKAKAGAKG